MKSTLIIYFFFINNIWDCHNFWFLFFIIQIVILLFFFENEIRKKIIYQKEFNSQIDLYLYHNDSYYKPFMIVCSIYVPNLLLRAQYESWSRATSTALTTCSYTLMTKMVSTMEDNLWLGRSRFWWRQGSYI